ncbi:ABC transporter permease [Ktedonospora formicarum]|uniref:ABC3 transporter permease C-terminal domain-containing protein n=1 Tax=Ktedonospora formicarum TaxID=2778364 RepID=A0A8J3I294_9CHLR|nr:ABC transporter permease [Ktedonospora formicarum]GHO43584.1 hypothetical protein KSX_17470 [Ktedonospora formicarum]
MTSLFGIPIETVSTSLLIITSIIIVLVVILALLNAIFFKIGVRNIPRRRMQMVLIVCALMLSTTLLSSVLTTGDVLTTTAQTVAVFNWGNVDELIEGGSGTLGLYSERIYRDVRDSARDDPDIISVGAGLRVQDLLIADQSSRQVRSKVTALGIVPGSELGFGGMLDQTTSRQRTISELSKNQVYLNETTAQFLNAHTGDKLYLYSEHWPGERFQVYVAGVVSNDGLVGDNPFILMDVETLRGFEDINSALINQIYVHNRVGVEPGGSSVSDAVTVRLGQVLPHQVHVIQVKQEGLKNTQKAEDIFSRIFALFTLFSLAIGLLLILLIFVLLAAERRVEMGMARAIGVQRRHVILMFLFEGAVYDVLASFVGLLLGVGGGAALIWFLRPIMERFDFPLKFSAQPRSFIIAYCLGVIFTFCSVVLSSWLVSRMNVIEALRDLPEPIQNASLRESFQRLWLVLKGLFRPPAPREDVHKQAGEHSSPLVSRWRQARRAMLEIVPETITGTGVFLAEAGILPLLAGWWLFALGLREGKVLPFSLGFSLLVVGAGLMLKALTEHLFYRFNLWVRGHDNRTRARRVSSGLFAALSGALLLAYWALPFDILAALGFRRFQGG